MRSRPQRHFGLLRSGRDQSTRNREFRRVPAPSLAGIAGSGAWAFERRQPVLRGCFAATKVRVLHDLPCIICHLKGLDPDPFDAESKVVWRVGHGTNEPQKIRYKNAARARRCYRLFDMIQQGDPLAPPTSTRQFHTATSSSPPESSGSRSCRFALAWRSSSRCRENPPPPGSDRTAGLPVRNTCHR